MNDVAGVCRRRATCRLCDSGDLSLVLSLTPTPPANAFVTADALNAPQECFPLDLSLCGECGHLQLLHVVDPSLLFADYVYVSGTSPSFVAHFEDYAASVIKAYQPPPGALVVDIGSNDGTLLGFFQQAGMAVQGIDPARDIAKAASEVGIETLNAFFDAALAVQIREKKGAAAVVTANNVFAHIDDLASMVAGVRTLLDDDGVFVFEVSYLTDVLEKTLFDTIYHEHLSYHTVAPLVSFFAANGMELITADRVDTHGGSLRGVAQLAGGARAVASSVAACLELEDRLGLGRPGTFHDFAQCIDVLKTSLRDLLAGLKAEGRSIAGYGAPAKATTLMYHFGLSPDIIDFIVDDSPLKQG
ncbi:MAG: class I SAM-dependent methyltransferase, partial [Alphaproteobacteria bacterium]|nr:class I SAM-dependent methyltransferase [Alphaproteobacteria bacterium]